jgi:hypothetical protein
LATKDDIWEDHRWGFGGMLSNPKMDSSNFSILEIIRSPIQAMFLGFTGITASLFLPLSYFGVKNIMKW